MKNNVRILIHHLPNEGKKARLIGSSGDELPVGKKVKITSGVVGSFLSIVILIIVLARNAFLTPAQAGLMVVALIGLYVGFGILIGVYRLITKLDELDQ